MYSYSYVDTMECVYLRVQTSSLLNILGTNLDNYGNNAEADKFQQTTECYAIAHNYYLTVGKTEN